MYAVVVDRIFIAIEFTLDHCGEMQAQCGGAGGAVCVCALECVCR